MSPPVTPYTTPALASILAKNLFRGQVPSASTPVTSTELVQLIAWVDSMINGDFRSVGYKVPFLTLSGETWPTDQTVLLQFMSSVGAQAMASGHILLPAPTMRPGRVGGEKNVYAVFIDSFRNSVRDGSSRFRAQYYMGTEAEKRLSEPHGPRTDFMEDYLDPTRYQLFRGYTDMMRDEFTDVQAEMIDWDYMYALRTAE